MTRDQAFVAHGSVMHVATLLHRGVIELGRLVERHPDPPQWALDRIDVLNRHAAEHVEVADLIAAEYGL